MRGLFPANQPAARAVTPPPGTHVVVYRLAGEANSGRHRTMDPKKQIQITMIVVAVIGVILGFVLGGWLWALVGLVVGWLLGAAIGAVMVRL